MKYTKIYLLLFLIASIWSCDSSKGKVSTDVKGTFSLETKEKLGAKGLEVKDTKLNLDVKAKVWYSPFVVDVKSNQIPFETISFKDVTPGKVLESRETTMESLAESLGMAISANPDFSANCEMRYDEEITKPDNHLACGSKHLYIDVWQNADDFGYSMWSGCSEDDEFAKASVVLATTDDPLDRIAPLVDDIHNKLVMAQAANCFVKTC